MSFKSSFVVTVRSSSFFSSPIKSEAVIGFLRCGSSDHEACCAIMRISLSSFHRYASIATLNSASVNSQNSTGFISSIAMAYLIQSSYFHCVTRFLLHRSLPYCRHLHLLRSLLRIHHPSLLCTLCTFPPVNARLGKLLLLPDHKVHLVFYRSAFLFVAFSQLVVVCSLYSYE